MRESDAKLAAAFFEADMNDWAKRAEAGEFNEFFGPYVCGISYLVGEMAKIGTPNALKLRARLINGDFDAGREESEEWANSPEGQEAMSSLVRPKR